MTQTLLGLLARHALNALGAVLLSKGIIGATMVEPVTGSLFILGSVVWSVIQKHKSGVLTGPPSP